MSLGGGGGAPATAEAMRLARLARMGAGAAGGAAGGAARAPAVFTPNADMLEQLQAMEFTVVRATRALAAVGNSGVDAALDWLIGHQDDADIDDLMPGMPGYVAPAADAAAAAAAGESGEAAAAGGGAAAGAGGGGGGGSMSTEEAQAVAAAEETGAGGAPGKRMSPEEVVVFLQRRRAEKAEKEKKDALEREIRRREDGRKATDMQEDIQRLQRVREGERIKMEAEFARREKQRLQVELLKDKVERYNKRGETPPPELQAQLASAVAAFNGLPADGSVAARAAVAVEPVVLFRRALTALSAFKVEGRGLRAAQTLRTLINNPLSQPGEVKFRSINMANAAIKERVLELTGGLAFLRAAGFTRNDEAQRLELSDEARKEELLRSAVAEIDAALAGGMFA